MGIRLKFNLGLLAVFLAAFVSAAIILDKQFEDAAREDVIQNARIMLSAANAVRSYTATEIVPAVTRGDTAWISPVIIPSYAAQTNFRAVRADHPEYTYKEAALNPTNPTDRASDWEADFINAFRNNPALTVLSGERDTPTGRAMTLALPLTIRDPACLVCHSTPDRAPPRMVEVYGPTNGFGWRLNETIGAQIISVPMALPLAGGAGQPDLGARGAAGGVRGRHADAQPAAASGGHPPGHGHVAHRHRRQPGSVGRDGRFRSPPAAMRCPSSAAPSPGCGAAWTRR